MSRSWAPAWVILLLVAPFTPPAVGQMRPEAARPPVVYEAVVPGLLGASKLTTETLPGVALEVRDLVLGPGKVVSAVPVPGATIVELRSGLVETTIDGQATLRRPGEYWIVRPGQAYGIRSLQGVATLRTLVFQDR